MPATMVLLYLQRKYGRIPAELGEWVATQPKFGRFHPDFRTPTLFMEKILGYPYPVHKFELKLRTFIY